MFVKIMGIAIGRIAVLGIPLASVGVGHYLLTDDVGAAIGTSCVILGLSWYVFGLIRLYRKLIK